MSVLAARCDQCRQLGFHPAQNWYPTAASKQLHVLNHLRGAITGFEDLFQTTHHDCFTAQKGNKTEEKLEEVCCAECGAVMNKKDVLGHCQKEHQQKKKRRAEGNQTKKKKRPSRDPEKGIRKRLHKQERPLVHSKHKSFKCAECKKSFGLKGSLNRHQAAVHQKLKPLSCGVCGKSLSHKYQLNQHQQIVHEGQKPFACLHCRKRFGHKCNLTVHERIHSGEKPYKCVVCRKRFSDPSHQRRHEKVVHKMGRLELFFTGERIPTKV